MLQVSQRLMMNLRLALSSLFLGVLTLFMIWAIQWVLESRKEITFDMPGDVTHLQVGEDPRIPVPADAAAAQAELKAFIYDRSLALIISTFGCNYPEMLVYDPHGLLRWFPPATTADLRSQASGAYLFKGTYSERRWSESAATPFLPQGVAVERVIYAPSGAFNRQYARRFTQEPLPTWPGYDFTINTTDPAYIQHILDLLLRMGIEERMTRKLPLHLHLILNPLFVITAFFLVAGHACTVLYWSLYLRGRAHEFNVRRCHGARTLGLIRENLEGGLPGLAAGGAVGVILSGLLLATIGHVPLAPDDFRTLAVAGAALVVSVIATWSVTLFVVLSFDRVRR